MKVKGETNGSVRLHVGGLARGVRAEELAALVARALPPGVAPIAEVMRDASTGIERGFGFVTVPGGEEAKAAAERAIAAYNGTKWKGNKIRMGFAKGDYLERLKCEWVEAKETKAKVAREVEEAKAAATDHASYSAPPVMRIRRRPGEPVILVDPTPIPWTRADAEWGKTAKAGSPGRHRRKRGVLGCKKRVIFPKRATPPVDCRDLWRKHLEERSPVPQNMPLGSMVRPMGRVAQQGGDEDANLARWAGDAGDEEPGIPGDQRGIEFVWDEDAGDSDENGDVGRDDSETREVSQGSAGSDLEKDRQDASSEENYEGTGDGNSGLLYPDRLGGDDEDEDNQDDDDEDDDDEDDDDGNGGEEDNRRKGELLEQKRLRREVKEEQGGPGAGVASAARKERQRADGKRRGVELDEHLARLLRDGDDDDSDGAAYDYELETAKEAGLSLDSGGCGNRTEVTSEELQAEREKSLDILAKILVKDEIRAPLAGVQSESSGHNRAQKTKGEPGSKTRSDPPSEVASAPTTTTTEVTDPEMESKSACIHSKRKWTGEKVNGDGHSDKRSSDTVGADGFHQRGRQHGADEAYETSPVGLSEANSREESQDAKTGGGTKTTGDPGQPLAQYPGERFVAHMSALTDIFRVEDKVSTKKNEQEKKKDKGFLVASLFDTSEGDEGAHSSSAMISSISNGEMGPVLGGSVGATDTSFSFSFAAEEVPRDRGIAKSTRIEHEEQGTQGSYEIAVLPSQSESDSAGSGTTPCRALPVLLWRSLDDVMAVALKFVRSGCKEDVEAAWLRDRKALTDDFKRKHKDAVKMRRGARVGTVGAPRGRRHGEAKRRKLGR